jgi:ABC-type bacteriocin/lantibiotic exporter with double-glycine peptidase domain
MSRFPFHLQTKDYTCGPACMRMALEFFGINRREDELEKLMHALPGQGTLFKDMEDAAEHFGLAHKTIAPATIDDIKMLLAEQWLVIVCYLMQTEPFQIDHYAIVRKLDKGRINLFDPWHGELQSYPIIQFEEIWKSRERPDKADQWLIALKKD